MQTWTPPTFLPQQTATLQQHSSFSAASLAAPSAPSAFGDYANMAQVVERLQAGMFEMNQKMAELESTIGALQMAAPEQQPEGNSG